MFFIVEKYEGSYRFTKCEGDLLQTFGYENGSLTKKNLEDCLPDDQAIRMIITCNRAWEGQAVTHEDVLNGIPYLQSVFPIHGEDGNVIQLHGFCVDMSKRDRATVEQLDHEAHYFKTLIRHHPDGIFTLNCNGDFLYINPKICEISGYEEKELLKH